MSLNIARRLKKRQPFAEAEQEAFVGLLMAADRVENQLGRFLRPFGLTPSQYNVLRILRGEGEPMPALEIRDRLIQAVPAITGLVDRLERQGHVSRSRSEADRRVVFVSITDSGLELLASIDAPLAELHRRQLGHLDRGELEALTHLLERVVAPPE